MVVLVVHQDEVVRAGLKSILGSQNGVRQVHEAHDAESAREYARRHRPAILTLPADWNGEGALAMVKQLREEVPGLRVIMHDAPVQRPTLEAAVHADVSVIIERPTTIDELQRGLHAARRNASYLSPSLSQLLVDSYLRHGEEHRDRRSPADALTPRELEVLRLLADGQSSKQIASQLHVSVRTVDTHRAQLSRKLKLKSIAELTKCAIRMGLTGL